MRGLKQYSPVEVVSEFHSIFCFAGNAGFDRQVNCERSPSSNDLDCSVSRENAIWPAKSFEFKKSLNNIRNMYKMSRAMSST